MMLLALLLASPQPAGAQVTGSQAANGCINIADDHSRVTASGRLTLQLFAGPPNYESIAGGDAEERTYILELPGATCIVDGGDFGDPSVRFVTVHVSTAEDALLGVLAAAVGRRVTVSGEGFGSRTGHHHAPLVILADRVVVE
jgi:hypothetical protein